MASSRLSAAFNRMSDRERRLVVGGGMVIAVITLVLAGVLVSRKVADLEEVVADNDQAIGEVLDMAPNYLSLRREQKAIDEQLTRATNASLQSTLLGIAKDIQFERAYSEEGGTQTVRLSDYIKFSNATEILAELTVKSRTTKKKRRRTTKGKDGKPEREVFLATIEVIFDRVRDTALFQFLAQVDAHPEALFGLSLDISRESPNHDHFRAKLKVGQFRYGQSEQ
mgnify:CR=1 FL=1